MIDVKIRWKSLHFKLERFNKVKNYILKSLIDLGSGISSDEEKINIFHNLVSMLDSVKIEVQARCGHSATLLSTAERLSFMIINLGNSDLAVKAIPSTKFG
jgi:wyosine [tRNA(Phe)-imidazoG37] synthetase (radical SAM superfamily)